MQDISEITLRRKAQEGKAAIMEAVVEFLRLHSGIRFSRTEIESRLGLKSVYTVGNGSQSYEGAFSSMLLSKLVEERRIERDGAERKKKAYWFRASL